MCTFFWCFVRVVISIIVILLFIFFAVEMMMMMMMWSSSVVVNVVSTKLLCYYYYKVNDPRRLSLSSRVYISYNVAGLKEGLTGWNGKMNVLDRFKASLQVVWTCIFCYSTLSLLGLGFINIGASCDKPLAEVLIGYGLLFLFGLVLEIMGMFRVDETKPMPINIAMGKMLFLVLCLLWTMISNIWTFSSVTCRGARTWNRVGLQKGAIGITIWMNIFCAIVLAFLFLILYGTCKGLVGYAYNERSSSISTISGIL